jgi:hypothetical protein
MPEGLAHRRCKDALARLIKAAPSEKLIRKGLRADRAGTLKGKRVTGEVDCTRSRGRVICVLTIFDRKTGRRLRSLVCPDQKRRS